MHWRSRPCSAHPPLFSRTFFRCALARGELEAVKAQLAEVQREHAPCHHAMESLQRELEAVRSAHCACEMQIKELKAQLARVDKELAEEVEKEGALEARLAKTEADVAKGEEEMEEEKRVFMSKDAEIADLKGRLATYQLDLDVAVKAHEGCADKMDWLRKELSEVRRSKDGEIQKLKAQLRELDEKLAEEMDKEEALAKSLADERSKEAELEQTLDREKKELERARAELATEAGDRGKERREFESKEAELADVRRQLSDLQRAKQVTDSMLADVKSLYEELKGQHASCLSTIADRDRTIVLRDAEIAKMEGEVRARLAGEEREVEAQVGKGEVMARTSRSDEARERIDEEHGPGERQGEAGHEVRHGRDERTELARKDGELEELRKQVADLTTKQGGVYDELESSLRKQIAGLELSRDYARWVSGGRAQASDRGCECGYVRAREAGGVGRGQRALEGVYLGRCSAGVVCLGGF